MQRVTIVDRQCGCPLVDRVWEWKEDERNPSTPAKIIHLFSHIARTLKEDQVKCVIFDQASDNMTGPKKRHNYNSHRYTTGLPSIPSRSATAKPGGIGSPLVLAYRQPTLQSIKTHAMEMWSCQNEYIIVALFISPQKFKDSPSIAVQTIADQFTLRFDAELKRHRSVFIEMSHDSEKARNNLSYMHIFESFPLTKADDDKQHNTSKQDLQMGREDTPRMMLTTDYNGNQTRSGMVLPLLSATPILTSEYRYKMPTSSGSDMSQLNVNVDDEGMSPVVISPTNVQFHIDEIHPHDTKLPGRAGSIAGSDVSHIEYNTEG